MYRLEYFLDGEWKEHSHPPVFTRIMSAKFERLDVGVPGGDADIMRSLLDCIEPPFHVLYVLLVARRGEARGRYQSPSVDRAQVDNLLLRFKTYARADGRFHLWVYSPSAQATLVWDQHNIIFAYGPLECFERRLKGIGFQPGTLSIPAPHRHNYQAHCDEDAHAMLAYFDWVHSELQPGDDY